jgi:hypothetical protein
MSRGLADEMFSWKNGQELGPQNNWQFGTCQNVFSSYDSFILVIFSPIFRHGLHCFLWQQT